MDLELQESRGGTRLRLRVKPGARGNAVLGTHGGALRIQVGAAPEKGRANRAVADLLAEVLGIAASSIELIAGKGSRDKTVWVPLSPHETLDKIRDSIS